MNSSEEGGDDDNQGKKSSYECTFCKRGFTNAQALGGHMNIHRKDRSKASKQPTSSSSSSSQIANKFFTNDEAMAFPYANSEQPMSQNFDGMYFQHQYFPTAPTNNYLVGNYNHQPSNVHGFGYEYPRSSNWSNLHLNQELQGPNLSLQIGSSQHYYVDNTHHQRIRRGNDEEENEVDLELRLGHDP